MAHCHSDKSKAARSRTRPVNHKESKMQRRKMAANDVPLDEED